MDWVFDHLQVIIAIAGAIAYWILQGREKEGEEDEALPEAQGKTFADPELAERTRRIREEIQRRIEQRTGHPPSRLPPGPSPDATPPFVLRPPGSMEPPRPAAPPLRPVMLDKQREAEILKQQAALQEKLAEVEWIKTTARHRGEFERATSETEARPVARAEGLPPRGTLRDDLRDPASLRRAFLTREILGPPVALRE
ncbi:MAG: hypothetical protein PHQ04_06580 [Opitutaceae bacterium]|nr:hypothetical protein [Opitutaceae bacterium]